MLTVCANSLYLMWDRYTMLQQKVFSYSCSGGWTYYREKGSIRVSNIFFNRGTKIPTLGALILGKKSRRNGRMSWVLFQIMRRFFFTWGLGLSVLLCMQVRVHAASRVDSNTKNPFTGNAEAIVLGEVIYSGQCAAR